MSNLSATVQASIIALLGKADGEKLIAIAKDYTTTGQVSAFKTVLTEKIRQRVNAGQLSPDALLDITKQLQTPSGQTIQKAAPARQQSSAGDMVIYKSASKPAPTVQKAAQRPADMRAAMGLPPMPNAAPLYKDAAEASIAERTQKILAVTQKWMLKDADIIAYIAAVGVQAVEDAIKSLQGQPTVTKAYDARVYRAKALIQKALESRSDRAKFRSFMGFKGV